MQHHSPRMSIRNFRHHHQAFTHMPTIFDNGRWAGQSQILANSASTLPQRCPLYIGSTPSGTLTGIPHLPYFLMPVYLQQRRTTIEGPVAESAAVELLKAGKEAELHDLYTNWTIELD